MATQKIAITVPPLFLKRVDQWAKKTGETPRPKVGASWRKFSQYAARTCLAMPSTLLAYFDHSSPTKSRGILVILRKSRSRFIVDELQNRLRTLEDVEITRIYDEVCTDSESSVYDHDLAEEMLSMTSIHEEEEKW